MKKYFTIYLLLITCCISCVESPDIPDGPKNGKKPTISTLEPENITFFTATLKAEIETGNGYEVFSRGFLIDTIEPLDPNKEGVKIPCGHGKGPFSFVVSECKSNMKYYYQAYAENKAGVDTGRVVSFYTDSECPGVLTDPLATNIVDGTAICGGRIFWEGNAPITRMGICWGYSGSKLPTVDDSVTDYKTLKDTIFNVKLLKIKGSNRCYFRAFAENKHGISYGDVSSFETPLIWEKMPDFPGDGRDYPCSFTLNNNFYVATGSGKTSQSPLKDTYIYKPTGENNWYGRDSVGSSGRTYAIGFALDDYGYVDFGMASGGLYHNVLYQYNLRYNQWRPFPQNFQDRASQPVTFPGRISGAVFTLNGKAYLVGGTYNNKSSDEVWKCTIDGDTARWMQCAPFDFKIYEGIGFSSGTRAFVGFGFINNRSEKVNTIWEYNATLDRWTEFASLPLGFQIGKTGVGVVAGIIGEKAYFMAGGDKRIWELDLNSREIQIKSRYPSDKIDAINLMFTIKQTEQEVYLGVSQDSPIFYKYLPLWDN